MMPHAIPMDDRGTVLASFRDAEGGAEEAGGVVAALLNHRKMDAMPPASGGVATSTSE